MNIAWRLQRVKEGGAHFRPDVDLDRLDDDAILGALAAAEVEYGKDDPASLASVIDWAALPLKGETVDEHRDRLDRTGSLLPDATTEHPSEPPADVLGVPVSACACPCGSGAPWYRHEWGCSRRHA
jgi:hypothetical protein